MTKGKRGRPRCELAQEAILEATHNLLTEKGGNGVTIEAIAKQANVGRPTIYRWWPSVADIVLDVVLREADSAICVHHEAPFAKNLQLFLRQSVQALNEWGGAHLRFLMAHAQKDEEFRERFRENFTNKRRQIVHSMLLHATETGEVSPICDSDLLIDLIFGPMWYRLLTGHAPLDESFANELAQTVLYLTEANPKT